MDMHECEYDYHTKAFCYDDWFSVEHENFKSQVDKYFVLVNS